MDQISEIDSFIKQVKWVNLFMIQTRLVQTQIGLWQVEHGSGW